MWLQACLNVSRTVTDNSAVPISPDDLAHDARRVRAAGAVSLHVHPRNDAGAESLAPAAIATTLTAIRNACPGLEVDNETLVRAAKTLV